MIIGEEYLKAARLNENHSIFGEEVGESGYPFRKLDNILHDPIETRLEGLEGFVANLKCWRCMWSSIL